MSKAFEPFTLPNGTQLKNRIVKAAMEEKFADVANRNQPSEKHTNLYGRWGDGGAGLILSGHIMIDPTAMAAPGDVLLAKDIAIVDEKRWHNWITATQRDGAQFWFQINHPGRQISKGSGLPTYAPSAIPLKLGALGNMLFDVPLEMTPEHIQDVIHRFAWTARKAEELGASGVEIHAAHGYLLSQFLSPLSNQRTDEWGGSILNRARLLFEVLREVRKTVSKSFGVGVKINSADFQRGGFAPEDLYEVVEHLNYMGLDLLELSGGNYESPVTTGLDPATASSTAKREAYFLDAAQKIKTVAKMPVLMTGGITQRKTLENVLNTSENFLAGIGTALGFMPDLPKRWMNGEDPALQISSSWVLPKTLNAVAKIMVVQYYMQLYASLSSAWFGIWPFYALVVAFWRESRQMKVYKNWIANYERTAGGQFHDNDASLYEFRIG